MPQMTENGFFRPFVTPEWVDPHRGCFSLILNNDNGLSRDMGATIMYAGSGGRHRGQNRTAPQSFHQTWDNLTNAALKMNCEQGLLVRVLRGPKLEGPYSVPVGVWFLCPQVQGLADVTLGMWG